MEQFETDKCFLRLASTGLDKVFAASGVKDSLALQAGHSIVLPASCSSISKRCLQLGQGIFISFSFQFFTRLATVFAEEFDNLC